jgi:hypothetical protein
MDRICTVLGLALLLAGCVTSKNPIGQTVGFKPDPALIGVWTGRNDDKKDAPIFTIYFLPKKDGDMTALAVGLPSANDEGGWTAIDLKVAMLGATRFMSAREVLDDGGAPKEMPDYTLLLYRFGDDDTLMIYDLDRQKIGALVDSGKLAGKAQKGDNEWDDVLITADSTSLDAFMKTPQAAALFSGKPMVLHRQKPPQ